MQAAHKWRVEHIERLKTILLSGSVATLLGEADQGLQEPSQRRCV
jgi:hypothetical protein